MEKNLMQESNREFFEDRAELKSLKELNREFYGDNRMEIKSLQELNREFLIESLISGPDTEIEHSEATSAGSRQGNRIIDFLSERIRLMKQQVPLR